MDRWLVKVSDGRPSEGDSPSRGPVYRSIFAKDGFAKLDGMNTVWDLFVKSCEKYAERDFLGTRQIVDGKAGPFEWTKYKDAFQTVLQIGSAFRKTGLEPHSRVGIYGANTAEWLIAMEACNCQQTYCVPLYDSLGPNAVEFIINHAEVSLVVVQPSKLSTLLEGLPNCLNNVKTVVSMGAISEDEKSKLKQFDISGYAWSEFVELGKAHPADPVPPSPEDICTIMYTSGTTGDPKGVLISHKALISAIAGLKAFIAYNNMQELPEGDVYLSYLPLAHVFDRAAEEFQMLHGSKIGFWQGDVKLLTEDIAELKPTFFCGVPRIFDRIYSGIKSKVEAEGGLKKILFDLAFHRKQTRLRAGADTANATPVCDALVFSKVKARLGGRVRIIVSGAAPLASHVEEFLKVCLCAPVVQGYGLTETCAGSFISYIDRAEQAGTVGPPLASIEVCLESVPEMNYFANGEAEGEGRARGEVCIKGDTVFSGYYKREDLTKEVLEENGWFHTGDVGEWQADGSLKLVDRKKNIFKLSQGEYVAVEKLENAYGECSAVDQVWVYGNSFESCLVAVAVPNQSKLEAWGVQQNLNGTYEDLCKLKEAKKHILAELNAIGKKNGVKGFEVIRGVHLDHLPFDMERDLLTPTFKKKRPQLLKWYKAQIDELYAEIKAATPASS